MRIVTLMENTCGRPDCRCEHGLSLYIETERHRLLADTGASPAFMENADILGVTLTDVDTVVISHGHYDHAGGLMTFAARNPDAQIYMQRLAGEDYFHGERYIGIDKRLITLPQVHLIDGNLQIDEELSLFSGITGRRCFPQSNLALSRRTEDGSGQDSFAHEQCLVIRQGERPGGAAGYPGHGARAFRLPDRFLYRTLYRGGGDCADAAGDGGEAHRAALRDGTGRGGMKCYNKPLTDHALLRKIDWSCRNSFDIVLHEIRVSWKS